MIDISRLQRNNKSDRERERKDEMVKGVTEQGCDSYKVDGALLVNAVAY